MLGVHFHLAYNTDVVVVRPFNHAGPRQSPTYVLAGLALQVAELELGQRNCIDVGNLEVIRDFTDVRDVVRGYRLLAQAGRSGHVYNLGSGHGTKLQDALDYLARLACCELNVQLDSTRLRPVDQPLLVADPSKLHTDTGWAPTYPIEKTLADMLETYRSAFMEHASTQRE
jgi:GDP-4-dehydro-6-deoxy-D-mannose reductase